MLRVRSLGLCHLNLIDLQKEAKFKIQMNKRTIQTDMKVHMHTHNHAHTHIYVNTHMFVYLSVCIDVYYVCKYLGMTQESMFNIVLRFILISVYVSMCHLHMGVHVGSRVLQLELQGVVTLLTCVL